MANNDKKNSLSVPGNTPICNPSNGVINHEWRLWFTKLYNRVGSSEAKTNVELDEDTSKNAEDIAGLNTRVNNAETDINDLEINVQTNTSDITALEIRVTTAENDIDNIEEDVHTNSLNINTLKARADTNDIVVAGHTVSITALNTNTIQTVTNLGTGTGIFKAKSGNAAQLKTIKAGTNVTLDNTTDVNTIVINAAGGTSYTLPIASATVLGGVKVGSGLAIDATTGVLTASGSSYVLPPATDTDLGGLIVGNGLAVDTDGLVTLNAASTETLGGVIVGATLVVDRGGALNINPDYLYTLPVATDEILGGVIIGEGLSITEEGILSATGGSSYELPIASSTVLGGFKVGANLTIDPVTGVLDAAGGGGGGGAGTPINTDITRLDNLHALTDDYTNTSVGLQSLLTARGSAYENTAVGVYALREMLTGASNTAVGFSAGRGVFTTAGNQNVFVGVEAGTSIGAYVSNMVAVGYRVFRYAQVSGNVGVGILAGQNTTNGTENTALGSFSLYGNDTGSYNTCVGSRAGFNLINYTNSSCLGYQAEVTGDNQVQIGNENTTTYVYGTVQNRSDARDKGQIKDTALGLSFVMKLRPVDYKWNYREDYIEIIQSEEDEEVPVLDEDGNPIYNEDGTPKLNTKKKIVFEKVEHVNDGSKTRGRYHHGLIAQEVAEIIEETGVDFGGFQDHSLKGGQDVMSIGYDELIAPLIKAIQEQQAMILALTQRVNQLENN